MKRTTTVRGSAEPKFTQGFHFNLTTTNIDVTSVSLQVFQPGPGYGKGGGNIFLKFIPLYVYW